MSSWVQNGFINKEFYAPFIIEYDTDYYSDLLRRYNLLYKTAKSAGADSKSLDVIDRYKEKILEAIRNYYHGNVISFHQRIKHLVKDCTKDKFAVDTIEDNYAFSKNKSAEIQFFRGRISQNAVPFIKEEMLYLPKERRGLSDSYRFSIPGVPCLYLGNSSYACWLELGKPPEHDFVVSPVLLDNTQKILNLAVMIRDHRGLNGYDPTRIICWLKLLMLMMATSYRVKEENRKFKSEYIVSQSIMLACNDLKFDGVAYYSKRVDDEIFSQAAINVALFVKYANINSKQSLIDDHIKADDSFNYQLFRQLDWKKEYDYDLGCLSSVITNNIGTYKHQYAYRDTYFCKFDQFLFSEWKDKDDISYGINSSL